MSEKSITRQQAGLVRRQKRAVGTPRSRWGLLWWQIRCVEGRRSVRCASQRSKSEIPFIEFFGLATPESTVYFLSRIATESGTESARPRAPIRDILFGTRPLHV